MDSTDNIKQLMLARIYDSINISLSKDPTTGGSAPSQICASAAVVLVQFMSVLSDFLVKQSWVSLLAENKEARYQTQNKTKN